MWSDFFFCFTFLFNRINANDDNWFDIFFNSIHMKDGKWLQEINTVLTVEWTMLNVAIVGLKPFKWKYLSRAYFSQCDQYNFSIFTHRILHICWDFGQFFLIYAIVAVAPKRLRSNWMENESRLQSCVRKWARTLRKWENPLGTLNTVTNEHRFISLCAHTFNKSQ